MMTQNMDSLSIVRPRVLLGINKVLQPVFRRRASQTPTNR
jgi:hypothetical protein